MLGSIKISDMKKFKYCMLSWYFVFLFLIISRGIKTNYWHEEMGYQKFVKISSGGFYDLLYT